MAGFFFVLFYSFMRIIKTRKFLAFDTTTNIVKWKRNQLKNNQWTV